LKTAAARFSLTFAWN